MSKSTPFLVRAYNAFLQREENVNCIDNALKFVNTESERIHAGVAWLHAEPFNNLAAGASLDHLIIPDSGGDIALHLDIVNFVATAGPAELLVYEDPFTDTDSFGTNDIASFLPRNRNVLTNSTGFAARQGPFIDTDSIGLLLDYDLSAVAAGGPIQPVSGPLASINELILDNTKQYLIRHTNLSANVASYTADRLFLYRTDI